MGLFRERILARLLDRHAISPELVQKLPRLAASRLLRTRGGEHRSNPSLGRNFEALDPLEWLARMSDHIPDPGQHRTVLYGQYANRARGEGRRDAAQMPEASTEPPPRRSSPTWARLIAKISSRSRGFSITWA